MSVIERVLDRSPFPNHNLPFAFTNFQRYGTRIPIIRKLLIPPVHFQSG